MFTAPSVACCAWFPCPDLTPFNVPPHPGNPKNKSRVGAKYKKKPAPQPDPPSIL